MSTDQVPAKDRHGFAIRTGITVAGNCHRVALAFEDLDGALATWKRVFGLGLMLDPVYDDLDNSCMGIVWAGNMPLLGMAATDPEGTVGRYLRRNGPSVQSLAWEIDDMWGTDHRLRANGFSITGVHIEGRHFFMHPRDTFGLLLEFTDDFLPSDPRLGDTAPAGSEAIIPIKGIARVTAAVPDLDAVITQYRLIFGVEPTFPVVRSAGSDRFADFLLGDLTVRLVQPGGDDSRYATSVVNGQGRLHSVALEVNDFSSLDAKLAEAGLGVVDREDRAVWLDPSDMQGIRFELVG